jgi:hypothetical protein
MTGGDCKAYHLALVTVQMLDWTDLKGGLKEFALRDPLNIRRNFCERLPWY